jgi:hypothetical protein
MQWPSYSSRFNSSVAELGSPLAFLLYLYILVLFRFFELSNCWMSLLVILPQEPYILNCSTQKPSKTFGVALKKIDMGHGIFPHSLYAVVLLLISIV